VTVCVSRCTGKERDNESGLDYFGYRHYSSTMGHWMTPDLTGLAYADLTNPQSLNLYSYVLNNPLKFTDPNGLYCAWEDGTSDDDPQDGGANKRDCINQGGHWTDDSNPCNGADNCTATFDWNKPTADQPQYGDDGTISYVPGPALSVDGLTYSGCMLNAPGGNYTVGANAIDVFQPGMQSRLTNAIQNLNGQGITPMITSGFRTEADQQRMRNGGSGGNPAASGYSHHQEGTAVDVNTRDGHFSATRDAMTAQGLTWGATSEPQIVRTSSKRLQERQQRLPS
jgi:RHS repeat-associated protein